MLIQADAKVEIQKILFCYCQGKLYQPIANVETPSIVLIKQKESFSMSSLIGKLMEAGWCYESNRPQHQKEASEIYKDWEIISYPELALHYLPTGEYFICSTNPSLKTPVTQAKIGLIKALIDSDS